MDLIKSLLFVERNGSDLEKARLYCTLYSEDSYPQSVEKFLSLQNEDGGFPFGMEKGNLSTINETTVALWWMEELNLLASTNVGAALGFLLAVQHTDGSWEEDPQVPQYNLPAWIQVGDLKTSLYLSAYASYWLAASGSMNLTAFRKALHFLIRNQDTSGKFYGYLHTTWIAAGVFLLAGERYKQIANKAIAALSTKAISEWGDSQLAWALDCLSRGGLPKSHPFIESCLTELSRSQKPDGSWASEDGETFAVSATIQVLKVFNRYGFLKDYDKN